HRSRQQARQILSGTLIAFLLFVVILPAGAGGFIIATYYTRLTANLPQPGQSITGTEDNQPSSLYDRTGQTLLWSVEDPAGDNRVWLALDDLPTHIVQATLLSEDPDFLETARFAPALTAQRLLANYQNGPLAPDATLTGKLVRNTIAPPPEAITPDYRAREYALVAELNRRHAPQTILEWHLNTSYYGNNAYGIDAAAQVYFGRQAADLTIAEAAMLAAIPTAPQYNPLDDIVAAQGRQAALLRDLNVNGVITEAEYTLASSEITPIAGNTIQRPDVAPEYLQYARRQAESILTAQGLNGARMVSRGGLKITTALDIELYNQTACVMQSHLAALGGLPPAPAETCPALTYLPSIPPATGTLPATGAVTVIDVRTGELLAAVGDITASDHEPGPLLYPFVHVEAFSGGLYNPATMVLDVPLRFEGAADGLIYTPTNPQNTYRGPIPLRDGMGASQLTAAAQIANRVGLDSVLFTARQLGMTSLALPSYDLSMLERGGSVSLLDASYTYSVFAAMGEMRGVTAPAGSSRPRDPVAVIRIEDAEGEVLWAYNDDEKAISVTPLIDEGLAYLVNDVLADPTARTRTLGAGNVIEASRPMAVIYGTAGRTDNWTVGYSTNMAVGVWLGRDDDAPLALNPYGLNGAATLWRALTDYAHDRYGHRADDWQQPLNVIEARVCERSGLRPNNGCPERTEIFLEGTIPADPDPNWQTVAINRQNGLLATANTPTSQRLDEVFFIPPADAAEWWEANNLPLPPTEFDTLTRPEIVQSTVILRPELLDYVAGEVDIRGSIDAASLQYYQLSYGAGLNPATWTDITGQRTEYTPGQSLGTWDTSELDGLYNLRLTAVMNDNSVDPYIIQVTVDNVPPAVELVAGNPGDVFTFLNNDVIPLTANVQDNVAIDYVEFYYDGVFVGVDETFPYGYEHPIERIGVENFSAVVFDAAGNQANAALDVEILRGGT
ncbi:MAG: transglycosylase domain-containing protein, partial [Chloroflexota bacterium]